MLPTFVQSIPDGENRDFMSNVYLEYYRLMYKIASEIDPNNAEDIIQDAFLKMLSHKHKLQNMDKKALTSYIALTVKTTALDWIRRQKAIQKNLYQGDANEILAEIEDTGADPSPVFFSKVAYEQLANLMKQLSSRERDLLMLKYFLSMDDRELAPLFGVKKDSVRKMVERARKKLLKLIEKENIFN